MGEKVLTSLDELREMIKALDRDTMLTVILNNSEGDSNAGR